MMSAASISGDTRNGAYVGESLRTLLAFAIDDACDLDAILERDVAIVSARRQADARMITDSGGRCD